MAESFVALCVRRLLEGTDGRDVIRSMRKHYRTTESCSFTSHVSRVRRHFLDHGIKATAENKHPQYWTSIADFRAIARKTKDRECKRKAIQFDALNFRLQYKMAQQHRRGKFCWGSTEVDEAFKRIQFLPSTMTSFSTEENDLKQCRAQIRTAKLTKHMDAIVVPDGDGMLAWMLRVVECSLHPFVCVTGRLIRVRRDDERGGGDVSILNASGVVVMQRSFTPRRRWSDADRELPEMQLTPAQEHRCTKSWNSPKVVVRCSDGVAFVLDNTADDLSISEHAAALLLACGRRSTELLNGRSSFVPIAGNRHCLLFSGQLKKPFGPATSAAYAIPLLVPAGAFLASLARLRAHQNDLGNLSNDEVSVRYNAGLNRYVKRCFPFAGHAHSLRGIYATVAFAHFDFGTKSYNAAVMQMLGHESLDVTLAYSHIVLRGITPPSALRPFASQ